MRALGYENAYENVHEQAHKPMCDVEMIRGASNNARDNVDTVGRQRQEIGVSKRPVSCLALTSKGPQLLR
jgi:hypothetical protein